ncbi:DDB1- and CUL4-associated factor 12-like [Tubulanus polymorphus]|uniref:DDB1- and CUL4-associated factor 12-like n=1 Tax=Tubulanus polymorphus TaxID=672921 RepID=UPI003DA32AB2
MASSSMDILKYFQKREIGSYLRNPHKLIAERLSHQIPGLFAERQYNIGSINKIFASKWVSDRQVVFGTKCNKLVVLDLLSEQMVNLPVLKCSDESRPADCPCGIHSIAVNPSATLLATGAEHTNDVAVYRLPTFDPVCVGESGHNDWIFDIQWLDDEFLVTGSRDSCMALWCVKDDEDSYVSNMKSLQVPEYTIKKPLTIKACDNAEKVRALAYNENVNELAALSLNAQLHIWDAKTFSKIDTRRLPNPKENVCLAIDKEMRMYAIGSQSHVTYIDTRCRKVIKSVLSKQRGCGIRSVSFNEKVVTIGTGAGSVLFYDFSAGKYLECNCGHTCMLNVGKGWLREDETYYHYFMDQDYPNAIYTHCYNDSGTKLFTAGGPLPAGLHGNYCGLWQ